MYFICYLLFLYYFLNLCTVTSLVADDSCFADRSLSVLKGISSKNDPLFHETLSRLKENPFTFVVRYCLGKDGNVSSQKFVQCVSSLNSCPLPWHSTINWEFCLCNTLHCVFKGCFQYWIKTADFTNTKCFSHCTQDSVKCLFKQTGRLPFDFKIT